MMTKYDYIHFKPFKGKRGYDCWSVGNTHLGAVEFDSYFKSWYFTHRPDQGGHGESLSLSLGCINDINHFMSQLKEER